MNALIRLWQEWLSRPRTLYIIVCVKTVVVMAILLFIKLLEGKNSAPVYMRF